MPNRRLWSLQEDHTLRLLREENSLKKWSVIAKKMEADYGLPGRTGKQCRERYHNHLDQTIRADDWTHDEEESLYRLHDQLGNKWSLIATHLPGRTDNTVKNHFYSKLRKNLRRLNKALIEHPHPLPPLKVSALYRILTISEDKFKASPRYDEPLVDHCLALKNRLYRLQQFLDESKGGNGNAQLLSLGQAMHRVGDKPGKSIHNNKHRDSQSKTEQDQRLKKQEEPGCPIYQIFKRVCEQMLGPI